MLQPEKVIIADDHPLFRHALLETLKSKLTSTLYGWRRIPLTSSITQLSEHNKDADLLLLDLNIPGAHGFSTLIHVRQHYQQLPVVVISALR